MSSYIISIDQSTQGTKALLFDENGNIVNKSFKSHKQIINDKGWVSHNPTEIYYNVLEVIRNLIKTSGIRKRDILALGISNQRETSLIWDKVTGEPLENAIVWQCSRATEVCNNVENKGFADKVKESTGIQLSPYFPASKFNWLLNNVVIAKEKAKLGELCYGTIDTWLIFKLTKGKSYKTDYSNASRTQLFNIFDLKWDREICDIFGINSNDLAEVCDSNSNFGETDFDGLLSKPIPILAVMGDSHGALFGQGCFEEGMIKTTYGTGSSIMMNLGSKPFKSTKGLVTSLAWCVNGEVKYVLEGNLNYTGAIITWLKDDLKLIASPSETEELAKKANDDNVYLIPAFTGLGAPYWNSNVKASIVGMSRSTGRNEIVKAGLESIAYQINDIIEAMSECVDKSKLELRVDGGPTRNDYLMQFQSDILQIDVKVPSVEELSAIGVAYLVGITLNLWDYDIAEKNEYKTFNCEMQDELRTEKYCGWKNAINMLLQ